MRLEGMHQSLMTEIPYFVDIELKGPPERRRYALPSDEAGAIFRLTIGSGYLALREKCRGQLFIHRFSSHELEFTVSFTCYGSVGQWEEGEFMAERRLQWEFSGRYQLTRDVD